ncbi:hypothetical protein BC940DRAFT_152229 [Gongronella butleri]|nr:hypothetical protein BC940DRAFT_152229 [Gongronella butleri]
MSSLSSYEGSERSVERRGVRSDLGSLDTSHTTETHTTTSVSVSTAATSIDTTRPGFFLPPPRDTDAWSVAATIDDQESVLSTNTQKSRVLYFDDHDQLGASSSSSVPPVPTANTTAAAAAAIGAAAAAATTTTTATTATATDATATMATTTATTTLGPSSSSMTPVLTKALMMMDDTDDAGSVGNRSLASRSLVAEYGDRTTDGGFASDLSLANDDEDDEHSMDDRSPASSLITHATDPFPPHFHQLQHHNGIRQQRRRSSGAGQLPSPRRSLPHPIQNDHLSFVVAHSPTSIDTNTQDTHTNASLHRRKVSKKKKSN